MLLLLALASATAGYYEEGCGGRRYADWISFPLPQNNRPVWREETKPLWHEDAWLLWRDNSIRTDRPFWKRLAIVPWTDARETSTNRLPSSASMSDRLMNYDVSIGIKFDISF